MCNAALVRVLDDLYGAFDRDRDASAGCCRRAFAVAVRDERVERARKRSARKRGGRYRQQPFDAAAEALEARPDPLADLTDAVEHLRRTQPVGAGVVTLRAFGNFTFREIAADLGLDESTVRKQFQRAQARLWRLFRPGATP